MKIFSLLVITFLLIQFEVTAQYGWFEQTSGTSEPLFSITFTDDVTGWAVGDQGIILKTTNGGDNWIQQTSGVTYILTSVAFADENIGLAVGQHCVLQTTNGGNSWSIVPGLPDALWEDVYFADDSTAWIVGSTGLTGNIYKTTDKGFNWINQSFSTGFLFSVYFIDVNIGWVVGHWDL